MKVSIFTGSSNKIADIIKRLIVIEDPYGNMSKTDEKCAMHNVHLECIEPNLKTEHFTCTDVNFTDPQQESFIF